ncbi:MAG: GNAT family N-acetyltransferase [Gemmatimonadota bacterium]
MSLAAGPSPQPLVRPALDADVKRLQELIRSSARLLSRGFYSEAETESAIKFVFGVDTTLVRDGTYFLVELSGGLLGCGGWSRRRTLYGGDQRPVGSVDELLDPARDAARIRAFFVAPEAARKGVGRLLLDRCTNEAATHGFRTLELMATLPGVPFYSAMGFQPLEDVVDRLPDGTPLRFVRMWRKL